MDVARLRATRAGNDGYGDQRARGVDQVTPLDAVRVEVRLLLEQISELHDVRRATRPAGADVEARQQLSVGA